MGKVSSIDDRKILIYRHRRLDKRNNKTTLKYL